MDASSPLQITLVCEGPSDLPVARALFDRELLKKSDKKMEDVSLSALDRIRKFELDGGLTHLTWGLTKKLAEDRGIRIHGTGSGLDRGMEAERAIRTLFHPKHQPQPAVLMLLKDEDAARGERIEAFKRVADKYPQRDVVPGCPNPTIEAWLLSCLDEHASGVSNECDRIKKTLGLDPLRQNHQCRGPKGDDRNCKVILRRFVGEAPDREKLIHEADEQTMSTRGEFNGLSLFRERLKSMMESHPDIKTRLEHGLQ